MNQRPITPSDLHQAISDGAAGDKPRLVDVREPAEYVAELGHIDGSELHPLGTLPASASRLTGETREIVCICKSGMRAGKAADFLAQAGHKVRVLTGGMMAWNEAKLPVSRKPG